MGEVVFFIFYFFPSCLDSGSMGGVLTRQLRNLVSEEQALEIGSVRSPL